MAEVKNNKRRSFLQLSTISLGAVGTAAVIWRFLKRMNPAKLMNYMMQSLETSNNVLILKDVLRYLKNKKTKIALYTYDAILFDFSKEDGKQTLLDIEEIMSREGKFPIKHKFSNNLVFDLIYNTSNS